MVELGEHCHTHIIPRMKKVIDDTDTLASMRIRLPRCTCTRSISVGAKHKYLQAGQNPDYLLFGASGRADGRLILPCQFPIGRT
jgi:hypothetical protein